MSTPGYNWTEDAVAKLKRLIDEGLSGTQIGLQMGVSRNAILGKIWRLGLHSKIPPCKSKSSIHTKPQRKTRTVTMLKGTEAIELEPEHVENPTQLFDLADDQCRWPVEGAGIDTLFCGAPVHGRHSYCWHHCGRAFNHRPMLSRAQLELHQRKFAKNKAAA